MAWQPAPDVPGVGIRRNRDTARADTACVVAVVIDPLWWPPWRLPRKPPGDMVCKSGYPVTLLPRSPTPTIWILVPSDRLSRVKPEPFTTWVSDFW